MTTDTDKLIEVLEEELTYIRGECERWHTLYVEEGWIEVSTRHQNFTPWRQESSQKSKSETKYLT